MSAGKFFRRGDKRPLRVPVIVISLRQVVILGGVGGPSVPRGCWNIEGDWEFGWLMRRKPGRAGGVCGEGTRRGAL